LEFDEDKEAREDAIPLVAEAHIVREGDIFQLGEHRIGCIDATDQDALQLLMDGKRSACIRTDPPYNINYKGAGKKTKKHIANDNMEHGAFTIFLRASFAAVAPFLADDGSAYVFHSRSTPIRLAAR